jgi:hypothetical protein
MPNYILAAAFIVSTAAGQFTDNKAGIIELLVGIGAAIFVIWCGI